MQWFTFITIDHCILCEILMKIVITRNMLIMLYTYIYRERYIDIYIYRYIDIIYRYI